MATAICTEHGILIPVDKVEEAATVYAAFRNTHRHGVWVTLEPAEEPESFLPTSRVTAVPAGKSVEFAFCGWICQGASTRRMRRRGQRQFSIKFRLSVFHANPEPGAEPNHSDCFPIRALAPREASKTSGLTLAINVVGVQE